MYAASCKDAGCTGLACTNQVSEDPAYTSADFNEIEGDWSYKEVKCLAGIIGGYRLSQSISPNWMVRLSVYEDYRVFQEFFDRSKFIGELKIS